MLDTLRHRKDLAGSLSILAAALTLVLLLAACGGGAADPGGSADGNASERANGGATAEADEEGARAVADEVTADSEQGVDIGNQEDGADGSGSASQATLEMKGAAGTAFSGTCEFGDESLDVSGEVPASFDLDLDGRSLECEILKEGEGKLRMEFDVGNSSNVYQTTSPDATVKMTYSESGGASFSYSSSSTSSSSSSSVTQQNSSVVQQNSSN